MIRKIHNVTTVKYTVVQHIETTTKGGSAGIIPSHVSSRKLATKTQKRTRRMGEKTTPPEKRGDRKEKMKRIRIDITNAATPPNLLGMERRIAYAKRKYHSGWMWTGVTSGFAGIKFSASIK